MDIDMFCSGASDRFVRYAFKAVPVLFYEKRNDGVFDKVRGYSVTFEKACDIYNISDIDDSCCFYDPYVISIIEPGASGDEIGACKLHSVIYDQDDYEHLMSFSNTDGLRSYTGVVEGIPDVRTVININVWARSTGLIRKPVRPFDEKAHKRYVQASWSYHVKNTVRNADNKFLLHDFSNAHRDHILDFLA